ncbi:hypothetical protein Lal_00016974 [Lupinus albus]|nr:hypothetical protein Lal_00016974 [Lupinus albus]
MFYRGTKELIRILSRGRAKKAKGPSTSKRGKEKAIEVDEEMELEDSIEESEEELQAFECDESNE